MHRKERFLKQCKNCHKSFEIRRYELSFRTHCSRACLAARRKYYVVYKLKKKMCPTCKRIFRPREKISKHCSRACSSKAQIGRSAWNKGKPWSEHVKEKMRQGHKNRPVSKGKRHSQKTKKLLSKRAIERFERDGPEGVPNWKGGITPVNKIIRSSRKYSLWRKSVFKRDNYICQNCGKRGNKLNAHHIKSFSEYTELRFDISNGKTLCLSCHENIHPSLKNLNTTT